MIGIISLNSFKNIKTLGLAETRVALRVLKYHFEEAMGFEMSDELFEEILGKIPYLRPLHPFGSGYSTLGYIRPLQQTLKKYHVCEDNYKKIMDFFCLPRLNKPRYDNLLLHIPHSSSAFPEESEYSWNDLFDEERLLIDYYTDELFVPEKQSEQISSIIFPYCRLYCDVERFINDPLEKDGLGISYSRIIQTQTGYTYRSFSSLKSVFKLYSNYHTEASLQIMESMGIPLVIDCHSFSSHPNLLCTNPQDIDICIGYNNDETCPHKVIIGNIIQYFKSKGYKVGVNTPFSNSKTFSVPKEYHSVMIEVNKRLYMDEFTFMKYDNFNELRHDIQSLYTMILKK